MRRRERGQGVLVAAELYVAAAAVGMQPASSALDGVLGAAHARFERRTSVSKLVKRQMLRGDLRIDGCASDEALELLENQREERGDVVALHLAQAADDAAEPVPRRSLADADGVVEGAVPGRLQVDFSGWNMIDQN